MHRDTLIRKLLRKHSQGTFIVKCEGMSICKARTATTNSRNAAQVLVNVMRA